MDDVSPRQQWIESTIALVRTAFEPTAEATTKKEAASILISVATMLDPTLTAASSRSLARPDARLFFTYASSPMTATGLPSNRAEMRLRHASAKLTPLMLLRTSRRIGGTPIAKPVNLRLKTTEILENDGDSGIPRIQRLLPRVTELRAPVCRRTRGCPTAFTLHRVALFSFCDEVGMQSALGVITIISFSFVWSASAMAAPPCPKGYVLNDDGICVPKPKPNPPRCSTPATDGTCLTITRDSSGVATTVTGTGVDGITRTLAIDFYEQTQYVGAQFCSPPQIGQPIPPDGQTCTPVGNGGYVTSRWQTVTYTDSNGGYLRTAQSYRPGLMGATFFVENRTNRVTISAVVEPNGQYAAARMLVNAVPYSPYVQSFEVDLATHNWVGIGDQHFGWAFPEMAGITYFPSNLYQLLDAPSGWGTRNIGNGVIALAGGLGAKALEGAELGVYGPLMAIVMTTIALDHWQNDQAMRDAWYETIVHPICAGMDAMDILDKYLEGNIPPDQTFFHAWQCQRN